MEREAKVAKAMVGAYVRSSRDKLEAAKAIADERASKSVKLAVAPPRLGSSLRSAGVLLILVPDPITAVPGVALLGASYALKKREAAGLSELVREVGTTIRELQSFL